MERKGKELPGNHGAWGMDDKETVWVQSELLSTNYWKIIQYLK